MSGGDESTTAADRWADRNEMEAQRRHVSPGAGTGRVRKSTLKGWRPLALLLILAIGAAAGLHFKILSAPGTEDQQFANQYPLKLDILVSNPRISIQVTDGISQTSDDSAVEYVSSKIEVPQHLRGTILVLASLRGHLPRPYSFYRLAPPPPTGDPSNLQMPINALFAAEIPVGGFANAPGVFHYDLGLFNTGPVIDYTNGAAYGNLPDIGSFGGRNIEGHLSPAVLGEEDTQPGRLRDIVTYPVQQRGNPTQPSSYRTPHGGAGALFWFPQRFSVSEELINVAPVFHAGPLDYVDPQGALQGDNYIWNSRADANFQPTLDLQPTFELTNLGATQSESDDAFLAGIMFGLAGAAAIALVQEIPEAFDGPRRWLRRNRTVKEAA
jgi:hypothetical protein